MTRAERAIVSMESLARHDGYQLAVFVEKHAGEWIIRFVAGHAEVYCKLDVFQRQPYNVIEGFCEELIKRNAR